MREIIAFLGFQGSGKGYQAEKLVRERNFIKISFADVLREMAFATLSIDFEEGMERYAELKQTEIYNGQNFRNILENLGSSVRKYSKDFWANAAVEKIKNCLDNVCIDDMRYANEYSIIRNYCKLNKISFKAVFCNYKSDVYRDDNPHESARLARHLFDLGYHDLQIIRPEDIEIDISSERISELSSNLALFLNNFKGRMK